MLKPKIMCAMAVTALAACTTSGQIEIPKDTYEECVYTDSKTEFALWAPTADAVELRLYADGLEGDALRTIEMSLRSEGLWKKTVREDLEGKFYTFRVKQSGEWLPETQGIAPKAVGVNGNRAAIIDWTKTDPEGWSEDVSPKIKPSDIIVYEMHHRDFSVHPTSGISHKGKFLALTETGTTNPDGLSTGIDHLKQLGVTYVQILPSYDYHTVDETRLDEPQYNWGYDPQNYNAVEGSYSTDPYDPAVRIREFKQMVQALHANGIRVIMDVVYNHTYSSELSGFERTMPGYFYRKDAEGNFCNASGCGNETASEQPMYRKYMIESLRWWMQEYHIDGFRFDLMAIHDIETMNLISKSLHEIDPDVVLYGEGWAAMSPALPDDSIALKVNTWQLDRVGAFSDNIRDAVRGPLDCSNAGFMDGVPGRKADLEFGIAGGVEHPQVSVPHWTASPLQHVSYVSCHDDHCLRDRLNEATKATEKQKLAMVKLAQTAVYTSQGIPFIYNGEEVFRHKYGTKNSYKSPDSINAIDWTLKTRYSDLTDYYCALAAIRHAHPGFCLGDAELIREKLEFLSVDDPCVVAFRIKGLEGIDTAKSLTVLLNGSKKRVKLEIPEGHYNILAQNGFADAEGFAVYAGDYISAAPTSATILEEVE